MIILHLRKIYRMSLVIVKAVMIAGTFDRFRLEVEAGILLKAYF
jgi:hypothetical protein